MPPFRWRLAEVPFDLDYDYWIDDADFDLDFHVRELALPRRRRPGAGRAGGPDLRAAARPLKAAVGAVPDPRTAGGRVAVMTKIHHAVVDGMSGDEIQGALLDFVPEGREPPPPLTEAADARARRARDARARDGRIAALPAAAAAVVPRALPNVDEVASLAGIPGMKIAGRLAARVEGMVGGRSRVVGQKDLVPPRTLSTAGSPPIAGSRSGACRWTRSRRSRTATAVRSTMSSSRSARGPCAAG